MGEVGSRRGVQNRPQTGKCTALEQKGEREGKQKNTRRHLCVFKINCQSCHACSEIIIKVPRTDNYNYV